MSKEIWREDEAVTAAYSGRTKAREKTLMKATMNMVAYFVGLGDDQPTAEDKVSQISTELAALLYVYTLGNTAPLIAAVNGIDEVAFPFMDASAKAALVSDLTPIA